MNVDVELLAMRRRAFFPGSFDPFTIGHMSIVERGLTLFDEIVIGVGCNVAKHGENVVAERVAAIEKAVSVLGERVRVTAYFDLTVDAARRSGAICILRGVRTVADYEYERTMADVNSRIDGIETVVLFARPELAAVSSSVVRELRHYGHDVSSMLP